MPFPATRPVRPDWSTGLRPTVAGTMNATCEVLGLPSPGVYDPATMTTTGARGPVRWVGACRVQSYSGHRPRSADQAGQEITTRVYLVQLDESGTPVPADLSEGWSVVVTDCPTDVSLVGRRMPVTDVLRGSNRACRDVICTDNLE